MVIRRYHAHVELAILSRDWAQDYLPMFTTELSADLGQNVRVRLKGPAHGWEARTCRYVIDTFVQAENGEEAVGQVKNMVFAFICDYSGWGVWAYTASESILLNDE